MNVVIEINTVVTFGERLEVTRGDLGVWDALFPDLGSKNMNGFTLENQANYIL